MPLVAIGGSCCCCGRCCDCLRIRMPSKAGWHTAVFYVATCFCWGGCGCVVMFRYRCNSAIYRRAFSWSSRSVLQSISSSHTALCALWRKRCGIANAYTLSNSWIRYSRFAWSISQHSQVLGNSWPARTEPSAIITGTKVTNPTFWMRSTSYCLRIHMTVVNSFIMPSSSTPTMHTFSMKHTSMQRSPCTAIFC